MANGTLLVGFGKDKPGDRIELINNTERLKAEGEKAYFAFVGRDSPSIENFGDNESPTIEESLDKMIKEGIDDIAVIPFMMASGNTTNTYIPKHLGIKKEVGIYNIEKSKSVTIRYLPALGESPLIAEIIDKRIKEMGHIDSSTAVMVVSYGSQMMFNATMAQENAKRLSSKGYKNVLTAFVDYNEPTIEDCAEFMIGRGLDKIIIAPLFISEDSAFNERVCNAFDICGGDKDGTILVCNREADICIMEPIGSDMYLTEVLKAMIKSAREA